MNQFFSNCRFLYYIIRDTFNNLINKNKIIQKIILINNSNNLTNIDKFFLNRPNLLYYLIKLEKIIPINLTNLETYVGDYYCHFINICLCQN